MQQGNKGKKKIRYKGRKYRLAEEGCGSKKEERRGEEKEE